MSELEKPITAPQGSAIDTASFGMEAYGGLHANIDTPLSESGDGKQVGGILYSCPNWRDCFGLGFQLDFSESDGSEYLSPSKQVRYPFILSKKTLKCHWPTIGKGRFAFGSATDLYLGFGKNFGTGTYEIGNNLSGWGQLRIAGRFGISAAPYFGIFNSIPKNSDESENISMMNIRLGVNLKLDYLDAATTPPSENLNDYDLYYFMASTAHWLAGSYAAAKALNEKSAIVSNAPEIQQLMGEDGGGGSAARMEEIPSLILLTSLMGANGMSGRLNTHLKADKDQRYWTVGTEVAAALGALALASNDGSNTMRTQAILGGMQLVNIAIAYKKIGLNRSSDDDNALSFVMWQLLLQGAAYSLGWGWQEKEWGSAAMMAGHQAMMANTLSPDAAETGWAGETASRLLTYSSHLTGESNLVGYQQINHMPNKNFYTSTGLYLQNSPVSGEAVQNAFDDVASRDPFLDRAKAKLTAGLGLETKLGRFLDADLLGAVGGIAPLYFYEGGAPKAGVGAEERLLLSWGKSQNRFQLGVQLSQELLDGKNFHLFVNPLVGVTF